MSEVIPVSEPEKKNVDLLDDILAEAENVPTSGGEEPKAENVPVKAGKVRRRKGKEESNQSPLPASSDLKPTSPSPNGQKNSSSAPVAVANSANGDVRPAPTEQELRRRLREKMRGNRQQTIQDRKKRGKNPSYPLTPIFFCDAENCASIMTQEESKMCPVCRCFYYCSKDCQIKDWTKHKLMCGKDPDDDHKTRLGLYRQARDAAQALYEATKDGNYITVIHEQGEQVVAAIFTTIAEKSNLLNWRKYIENPIYTTAGSNNLAQLSYKLDSAIRLYPNQKIYLISCILDRLRDGSTTECVIRLFVADRYGQTMNAPGGKMVKTIPRFVRKNK